MGEGIGNLSWCDGCLDLENTVWGNATLLLARRSKFPRFRSTETPLGPSHPFSHLCMNPRPLTIGNWACVLRSGLTLGGLVGNIALSVAIETIIHTLNLLFGILSPTIQSLRLHYVEFRYGMGLAPFMSMDSNRRGQMMFTEY